MFSASKNEMLLLKIGSFRVLLSLSECPVCLLEFLVALFRLACHCLIFLYGGPVHLCTIVACTKITAMLCLSS